MKLQWFWDGSYEGLMGAVGQWLAGQADITVVSTDLRMVPDPNGTQYWYWTMIYKK